MVAQGKIRSSMRLYAVTDRSWLKGRTLASCVAEALEGGVTCVQLREKYLDFAEYEAVARSIKPLCAQAGVPFLINDRVDVALRVKADGVHVGQGDMACAKARELLGSSAIVGVSVGTLEEAYAAQDAGADYLGVGALFATTTKEDASMVSLSTLKEIGMNIKIPVLAIGGLTTKTISQLAYTGIEGVAVVSALFAADDIKKAAQDLRVCVDEILGC